MLLVMKCTHVGSAKRSDMMQLFRFYCWDLCYFLSGRLFLTTPEATCSLASQCHSGLPAIMQ